MLLNKHFERFKAVKLFIWIKLRSLAAYERLVFAYKFANLALCKLLQLFVRLLRFCLEHLDDFLQLIHVCVRVVELALAVCQIVFQFYARLLVFFYFLLVFLL